MSFLQFCVKRHVAIFCLMIAVVGFGINSYRKLPLEELPKTEMPYVTIVTVYPGASPEEIEIDIAKPIEDAVGSIDGLKNLTSSCMENLCQTMLEFEIGIDHDAAASDVRERVEQIVNDFPDGVEKSKILKFDINAQSIVNIAITGDLPLDELYDYADNEFRDKLATIKGVADISLSGGSKREVQVLLDRQLLVAKGLTSVDIVATLEREIKMIPIGRIRQQGIEYSLKFDAEAASLAEIENLEIANIKGQRSYLKDVAIVVMGTEELRQMASINGRTCVAIKIIKKADANAVEVVKRVRQNIEELKESIPGGIEIVWISDIGDYIQDTVKSAVDSIWQGILLTAILMFFFLYNLRSTLTVAITMPITVIAGVFFISLIDSSLNSVTLLALGLSIGILVTNSIVVLESIVSVLKSSKDSKEAAVKGSQNVLSAVMASAGTNIVVLFPITMMQGQIGQFFIPFAITMVGITFISLFTSFSLTPALAGQIINSAESDSIIIRKMEFWWNNMFGKFTKAWIYIISKLTSNRLYSYATVLVTIGLFIHAILLVPSIGFTFIPVADRGEVMIKLEFPTSFSLKNTNERVVEIEKALKSLPYLNYILTTTGKIDGNVGQTSEGVNLAQIFCKFANKTERRETNIDKLRDIIHEKLSGFADVLVTISVPDPAGAGAEIRMIVTGKDFATLNILSENLSNRAKKLDWLQDIDTSVRPGKPELRIKPRRAVLSDVKVPATLLGLSLRTNIEGTHSASYKEDARTYDIRVKLAEEDGLEQISRLELPGASGYPIILENFVNIEQKLSPILITRRNKSRASMFYANTAKGEPLGRAAEKLLEILESDKNFTIGYKVDFLGKVEAMNDGIRDFIEVGIIAFILTYLVLAAILNSFSQPIIILLTIPLGLIGCIWSLYMVNEPISMMVLLGGVMLIGIVVNNAILIMDRLSVLREEGMPPDKAMLKAIEDGMRAVTMITLAAVFGMLPMALDTGLGSESRSGIGFSAIGGIAISAIFTMLLLPVFYSLANKNTKDS